MKTASFQLNFDRVQFTCFSLLAFLHFVAQQITIHDSDDEDEAGSKAKAVKVLALEEDQSNGRGRSPSLQVKERAAGREADASADLDASVVYCSAFSFFLGDLQMT